MYSTDIVPHVSLITALSLLLCILHMDSSNFLDLEGICFDHARKPPNLCNQHWMTQAQTHSCLLVQRDLDQQCTGLTSEKDFDSVR